MDNEDHIEGFKWKLFTCIVKRARISMKDFQVEESKLEEEFRVTVKV